MNLHYTLRRGVSPLVSLSLLSLFIMGSTCCSCCDAMQLGPIAMFSWKERRRSKRGQQIGAGYNWQANVDRATGLASSLETSCLSHSDKQRHGDESTTETPSQLLQIAEGVFSNYPLWLCRFPITFGFLHAVPVGADEARTSSITTKTRNNKNTKKQYQIRTRLFGIHLLTFGVPNSQRISFVTTRKNHSNNNDHSDSNNGKHQTLQRRTTVCTVSVPLMGGWMVRSNKNHSKKERGGGGGGGGGASGYMLFIWTVHQDYDKYAKNDNTLASSSSSSHGAATVTSTLTTRLLDYPPTLVGKPPVHALRKWFYLSTQSVIHGYVMWRYHGHVRRQVSNKKNTGI